MIYKSHSDTYEELLRRADIPSLHNRRLQDITVLNMEKPVDGSKQGHIKLDETHNQSIQVSNMAVYSRANLL